MSTISLRSSEGRWVLFTAIISSAMGYIDMTALNVALPSLQHDLNAKGSDLFWILNGYLLVVASLTLIGGSLGDKLGRRKVYITGVVVFVSGSVCCGLSPHINSLVGFRVLQGLGGSLMVPSSLALLSSTINASERGKAIGIWSAFSALFMLGGPVLGGLLAEAGMWRYIFFINAPLGFVVILSLVFKIGETKHEDPTRVDLSGAMSIALGLASLTFGFLRIPYDGLQHSGVRWAIVSGAVLIGTFIVIEANCKSPMMPLKLFNNKTFTGVNLLTFFLYAGLGTSTLFVSLNLIQVQGYRQSISGLTFIPFTVLLVLSSRYIGSLADKYGARPFLIAGPIIAGTGQILLSLVGQTVGSADYFATFFPGIVTLALGMSLTVAPLTTTAMSSVDNTDSGIASGINNSMASISGVVANAVFGALAVIFFASTLRTQLDQMTLLSDEVKLSIMSEAGNLGNAQVPVSASDKAGITTLYQNAFIYTYSVIMRICASLSFVAALMTIAFIPPNKKS